MSPKASQKGVKMLVLSRRPGEQIVLPGTNMTITVVEVRQNGVVRLGFEAPLDVEIKRAELLPKEPPATKPV